eukprot:SAG31_NODE_4335_length_3344_cov_2.409245_3_plen_184_part_00
MRVRYGLFVNDGCNMYTFVLSCKTMPYRSSSPREDASNASFSHSDRKTATIVKIVIVPYPPTSPSQMPTSPRCRLCDNTNDKGTVTPHAPMAKDNASMTARPCPSNVAMLTKNKLSNTSASHQKFKRTSIANGLSIAKRKKQETRDKRQETRNKKQETRNKKHETRNKKQETRNKKQERARAN